MWKGHDAIRHRELKCIKKGVSCGYNDLTTCCGKLECDVVADVDVEVCCIPSGAKGCENDDECCGELTCDALESLCGSQDENDTGERQVSHRGGGGVWSRSISFLS